MGKYIYTATSDDYYRSIDCAKVMIKCGHIMREEPVRVWEEIKLIVGCWNYEIMEAGKRARPGIDLECEKVEVNSFLICIIYPVIRRIFQDKDLLKMLHDLLTSYHAKIGDLTEKSFSMVILHCIIIMKCLLFNLDFMNLLSISDVVRCTSAYNFKNEEVEKMSLIFSTCCLTILNSAYQLYMNPLFDPQYIRRELPQATFSYAIPLSNTSFINNNNDKDRKRRYRRLPTSQQHHHH